MGTTAQQTDQGDHLRTAFRLIREMEERVSSFVAEVTTKCEQQGRDLLALEDRYVKSWVRWQKHVQAHDEAYSELQESHNALQNGMSSHAKSQEVEAAQLRMHSTHNFIEQMDKALKIQQSLSEVERGHMELVEKVRNIRLPKV